MCMLVCASSCTEPRRDNHAGTYMLVSLNGNAPPPRLVADLFVLSSSITLQVNGSWVSAETDSSAATAQRFTEMAGGGWKVNGSVLTLTDTTAAGAGRSFSATISTTTIVFQYPSQVSVFERQ